MMKYKPKSPQSAVLIAVIVVAAIVLLSSLGIGTLRSGIRIGYVSHDSLSGWSASYFWLLGRLQHTIYPETDTLHVEVKTESGVISIEMKDMDGNVIFSENNIGTSSFEVNVSGKVVVKIEADQHKGGFAISSRSSAAAQSG